MESMVKQLQFGTVPSIAGFICLGRAVATLKNKKDY
jgi:hypothetical protein